MATVSLEGCSQHADKNLAGWPPTEFRGVFKVTNNLAKWKSLQLRRDELRARSAGKNAIISKNYKHGTNALSGEARPDSEGPRTNAARRLKRR